jgi:hypothetical protein
MAYGSASCHAFGMEKASDDYQGKRVIDSHGQRPQRHPVQVREPEPFRPEPVRPPSEPRPKYRPDPEFEGQKQPMAMGMSAGYGLIKGKDIYQVNQLDLSIGSYFEKNQLISR